MKVWQGTGWEERIKGLQGNSLKILLHLVNTATFCNIVPGPSKVALATGFRQPHISRAYRELKKADFIYQKDGVYYLNPYFCWKGNERQYEQACREFSIKRIQSEPAPMKLE